MKPLKKRKSPLHHDPKSHLDKDHSQKSPHFSPKKRGSSFLILALTFLAVIAFAWFSLRGGVASVIHEDVPLNTLINRYASGVYDEIIIEDGILTANRKEALVVDALGRSRRTIESDRVLLPPNDSITEL
jgi:hypothetical protein